MADETEEPGERQDPDLPEIPPGSDVSADDPGPIEIDFIMKSAPPAFGDLLAEWDAHREDADGGQDRAARWLSRSRHPSPTPGRPTVIFLFWAVAVILYHA